MAAGADDEPPSPGARCSADCGGCGRAVGRTPPWTVDPKAAAAETAARDVRLQGMLRMKTQIFRF